MTRLFQGLALLVAVACITWVAVLWRWQATQRDMSVEDIGLYLVALPLVLFVLVLLARWAWRGAQADAKAREEAAAAAAAAPAPAAAPSADEAERRATVQLLAAHLHCRAGRAAADVLYALDEGKPRPDLDPELRDDEGLPLMTARLPGLKPEALQPPPDPAWRDELQRALAALEEPLQQALSALAPWRPQFGLDLDADAKPGTSVLRVAALWPAEFDDQERQAADDWLLQAVRATLPLPAERLVTVALPPAAPWPEAERLLRLLDREGRPDALLLTAAHSAIGERSVRRLLSQGRLFTSRSAQRPIAGEAAAALLLAPPCFPAAPDADAPPLRLHRAGVVLRDKPVDDPGRTSAQAAQQCIEQALACAALPADQIAGAVHDADQHTPRAAEALTALLQAQPHLQPADDVLQTGALNGQTGCAAPLITIALAAHQAAQSGKPCLAVSVDDARLRLALVARPANFEPAAAAA